MSPPTDYPRLSWYRAYVHPWLWMFILFWSTLYGFAICGNLTTFRIQQWKQHQQTFTQECIKEVTNKTIGSNTSGTISHASVSLVESEWWVVTMTDSIISPPAPAAVTITREEHQLTDNSQATPRAFLLRQSTDDQSEPTNQTILLVLATNEEELRSTLPPACLASIQPLADLMLLIPDIFKFPTYLSRTYLGWQWFVDMQPACWPVVLILLLVWQRDMTRVAEVVVLEFWILGSNGITHILTVLPDAGDFHPPCHNDRYAQLGWWIFTRISSEYCGDMLWSGHTFHTLLAMIMIYRIMKHERNKRKQREAISLSARSEPVPATSRMHRCCGADSTHIIVILLMSICFMFELYGILKIRYHYSIDLFVAILVTILATTSTWITVTVKLIYRPHIIEEIILKSKVMPSDTKWTTTGPMATSSSQFPLAHCGFIDCCCARVDGSEESQPSPPGGARSQPTTSQPIESIHSSALIDVTEEKKTVSLEPTTTTPTKSNPLESHRLGSSIPNQSASVELASMRDQLTQRRTGQPMTPATDSPTAATIDSDLDPATREVTLNILRGSECALRYLSFSTHQAYQTRLDRIGHE